MLTDLLVIRLFYLFRIVISTLQVFVIKIILVIVNRKILNLGADLMVNPEDV